MECFTSSNDDEVRALVYSLFVVSKGTTKDGYEKYVHYYLSIVESQHNVILFFSIAVSNVSLVRRTSVDSRSESRGETMECKLLLLC